MSNPIVGIIPLDNSSVNYECLQMLGKAARFFRRAAAAQSLVGHALARQRRGALARLVGQLCTTCGGIDRRRRYAGLRRAGQFTTLHRQHGSCFAAPECLLQIEQTHPHTTLLAFNVLMRITATTPKKKKAYWADYGKAYLPSLLPGRPTTMAVGAPAEADNRHAAPRHSA